MQFLWTWEDCDFEDPCNSESLMLNKVNIFLCRGQTRWLTLAYEG